MEYTQTQDQQMELDKCNKIKEKKKKTPWVMVGEEKWYQARGSPPQSCPPKKDYSLVHFRVSTS